MIDKNFSIIYVVLIAFFFLFCYLVYQIINIKKRLDVFFKKGDKDLGEVLTSQIKNLEAQGKNIEKIFTEIEKLNKISITCFQKVGVIRFNPFKEVGGDQSFSIALLDANHNGFVVTGLYTREGNRIFAKPIENGQSKYLLSGEEKEAIRKAIGIS
jgi:hypothetical protein